MSLEELDSMAEEYLSLGYIIMTRDILQLLYLFKASVFAQKYSSEFTFHENLIEVDE